MAFGLVKDVKPILAPLTASVIGSIKTFIISYAENKILDFIIELQKYCPPPGVLQKIAKVLSAIRKLISGFQKKIAFLNRIARILLPAIAAAKIVVRVLSKLPIPAGFAPVGVITSLSNLLVFMRKLIDIFEDDIQIVVRLLGRLASIFDPTLRKLNAIEAVCARCAETPDIYGGSGYTWGRLSTGSIEALACMELNTSGNYSLFPRGVIVVDDKRNIISCYNTGSFITGSTTTDNKVLIDRTGVLDNTGLGGGTTNLTGTGVGITGNITGTGQSDITVGTDTQNNNTGTGIATGGINNGSGFGIGGQGGTTTTTGTFLPDNQSSTGGSSVNSQDRNGNGTDGISNRGSLIPGTGTSTNITGIPPSSINPGRLPTNTGVFIDGEEVGFTPEGRLALLFNLDENNNTALLTDVEYKARNKETYFLSVLEDETTEYIAPRRYAVAKDRRGVIVLQGPKSFASNQQVLIDELKFRIDRQLP